MQRIISSRRIIYNQCVIANQCIVQIQVFSMIIIIPSFFYMKKSQSLHSYTNLYMNDVKEPSFDNVLNCNIGKEQRTQETCTLTDIDEFFRKARLSCQNTDYSISCVD